MDPATIGILQAIGNDLVRAFAAIVVETFFLALYTVLIVKATQILIRKGLTKVPLITLIVLLVMYAMALVMWGFDVTNFVREAQTTLIRDPDLSMGVKYATALHKAFTLVAPLDLLYAYMSILGDGIIIWRVYVLWRQDKGGWVVLIPLSFLLGSLASVALLTYCVVDLGTEIVDGSFQSPAFCKNVQTASYSMATVTTAVATILIAWKTWEYRQSIKPMVTQTGRTTRAERVMVLLVESGILYFLFFLVQVIGNIPGVESDPKLSFAFFVYSFSTSVVVGIYPTLVIILSHSDHAVLDTAVASTITPSNYTANLKSSFRSGRLAFGSNGHELSSFATSAHSQHADGSIKPVVMSL